MVYIVLGKGFEESEAVVPCDLLRRAGVEVQFAGIGGQNITGSNGITVHADCTVEDADLVGAELVVLPGGWDGVMSIKGCPTVMNALVARSGKRIAAICAAPTALASVGITDGKKATCYPGLENMMGSADMQAVDAITDGLLTTGRAPGAAFEFGLELVRVLCGEEKMKEVAGGLVY